MFYIFFVLLFYPHFLYYNYFISLDYELKHDEIRRGTILLSLLILFFIYYSTINLLNSITRVLFLFFYYPKAIIFIYYGCIDLINLLIAFNDPH